MSESLNEQKKQREFWQLERFKQSYQLFPEGEIIAGEKPDFIINSPNDRIGIELTEFYNNQPTSDGRPLQEQESLQKQIVQKAWALYEEHGGPKLYVNVLFGNSNLTKKMVDVYAKKLATLISEYQLEVDTGIDLGWDIESICKLPAGVQLIQINRYKKYKQDLWTVPMVGWVGESQPEYLQGIIDEKNVRYATYRQNCDIAWLLITVGNSSPSSFTDITDLLRQHIFDSKFDRVFFFLIFDRKIVELKLSGKT